MSHVTRGVLIVLAIGGVGAFASCTTEKRDFDVQAGGMSGLGDSGDSGSPSKPVAGSAGSDEGGSAGAPGSQGGEKDVGGSAGSSDNPPSNAVTGLLFDTEGQRVIGAPVEINGVVATTDDNGAFTVADVPPKYDAVVVSELYKEVDTYEGLSTRSPHFTLISRHLPTFGAKLRGALTGGAGFPSPSGHLVAVTAVASDLGSPFKAAIDGAGYNFADLTWGSSHASVFTFGALQWSVGSDGLPASYDGWGTKQLKLTNGADSGMTDGSTPAYNIAVEPIESHLVAGAITAPSGCKIILQVLVGSIEIVRKTLASNSFSYLLPSDTPGAALQLNAICAYSTDGSDAGALVSLGLYGQDALTIAMPASPVVSLPIADATGVTSATQFSWAPGDGALNMVTFFENEPENWSIIRYGSTNTTTFPDLVRFGIPFPKNLQVAWGVNSVDVGPGATGTTDDALASSLVFVGKRASLAIGESSGQSFTTAP